MTASPKKRGTKIDFLPLSLFIEGEQDRLSPLQGRRGIANFPLPRGGRESMATSLPISREKRPGSVADSLTLSPEEGGKSERAGGYRYSHTLSSESR